MNEGVFLGYIMISWRNACLFFFLHMSHATFLTELTTNSHFLVASFSLTRPVSLVGVLYSRQALVMWSCLLQAPHSQAALSVRPHDHMDELNLPKPLLRRFSIQLVYCWSMINE